MGGGGGSLKLRRVWSNLPLLLGHAQGGAAALAQEVF